jgi:hypothetical protein
MDRKATLILCSVIILMTAYLLVSVPHLLDDGFQYEGFAEALARGNLDFSSYYGFQGLSILAVPIYWLTSSPISIIITSMILSLLSIPLAYGIGKIPGVIIFLLTSYPFMTMLGGFQESALLFFILLVIYGAKQEKVWSGLAWGFGSIVKPFTLSLVPLFLKNNKKIIVFFVIGILIGVAYGAVNYMQTGHFVTLAASGTYEGVFDPSNIPPLEKSFTLDWKSWARVVANLFVPSRKIMLAPALIVIGAWSLWSTRKEQWSKRVMTSIALNILMVGPITYAFPKYLLPAAVLFAISAIPLLAKRPILWIVVFVDSALVFVANYNYFAKSFWSPDILGWMPFVIAIILCIYEIAHHYSHAQRV